MGFPREEELAAWVRARLSPERWRHTQGVLESALSLARRWGVSEEKARVAALLHDAAREESPEGLLKMAGDFGIVRDKICDAEPVLYHGPLAAALARTVWRIDDPDVLHAIAYHTTGRPGMSPLEKVIFLADALEPGRQYPGVDALRDQAFVDLDGALRASLESSIVYLIQRGQLIHPDTLAARNQLVMEARS